MGSRADAASLIREARRRHGFDQRKLARRAGTSQTHVSRIERAEISPTVDMLSRLLAAMGERLEVVAVAAPAPGQPGYFPSERDERRADFRELSPGERVAEAISISRTATRIALAAQGAK